MVNSKINKHCKPSNINMVKTMSEEAKNKIRASLKGKTFSEERINNISKGVLNSDRIKNSLKQQVIKDFNFTYEELDYFLGRLAGSAQKLNGRHNTKEFKSKFIYDIFKRDNLTCHYCGKKNLWHKQLTLDHKIPVSKGGQGTKDNLVVSCLSCNASKCDKDYEVFKNDK